MHFVNPVCFCADLDRSRVFYRDVLGLRILEDEGGFIRFDGGFAIHDGAALIRTIFGATADQAGAYGRRNLLLYLEDADVDAAFARIAAHAEIIHPVERQHWGQRVFRFYDPDRHIVEIGEPE